MKKVLYLHGTGGAPNEHWAPALLDQFSNAGYQIIAPELPNSELPDMDAYSVFLQNLDIDFSNAVLVGHSSGATTILNLLQSDWFPVINAAVLVGVFLNEDLTGSAEWYKPGQFDNLFPVVFDIHKIKARCDRFYFVHGDNDPYCSYDDAQDFCNKLAGKFITVEGGHHLGKSSTITELPTVIEVLQHDGILR